MKAKKGGGLIAGAVVLAAALMLGMSFAAVPLYRLFCAHTGFSGTPQIAKTAPTIRGKRTLVVRFDTNVGRGLAWSFAPDQPQISLRTGQTATVFFKVTNNSDREVAAQASFNVTPDNVGAYFDKISCFCFSTSIWGRMKRRTCRWSSFSTPRLKRTRRWTGSIR